MHLTECDAFTIAESELRRAVWLNPYEAAFMANLAWCLHRQGRSEEAQQCLEQALEQDASNVQVRRISVLMESSPNKGNGSNDNRKDG
jgi:Flp pilus assembly protein TadD